jgi:hypothetical protein
MATINVGGRTVEVPDNLDPRSAPSAMPGRPGLRTSGPGVIRPAPGPGPATRPLTTAEAAAYNTSAEGRATRAAQLRESRGYFQGTPTSPAAPTQLPAPSGLRRAVDKFTAPTPPAASTLGRVGRTAGRALGVVGGVVAEGAPILDVARNTGSTKIDVATQAAEGVTRLATAGLGAKAGAMGGAALGSVVPGVGTAVGGVVGGLAGGAAGYFGGDAAIKGLRSALDVTEESPVDRMRSGSPNPPSAPPAMPDPAPAPTLPVPAPALTTSGSEVRRIDGGGSPLFTNVGDGDNTALMARGVVSAQNTAAADALARRSAGLRSPSLSPSAPSVPVNESAPTVLSSANNWQARNDLRNLRTAASSITENGGAWDQRRRGDVSDARRAYTAALENDLKLRGLQPELDTEMRKSGNSLRGQINDANQRLAGDQYRADQNLRGQIFNASTTAATARAKSASDAIKNAQGAAESNSKAAISQLESLAVEGDEISPARLAQVRAAANSIAPGFELMDAAQRAEVWPKVLSAVRAVQGMNDLRDPTLLNMVGLDNDSPAINTLPDMTGARVDEVGLFEGLRTPKVSSGDYKISMSDGTVRHLPRSTTDQNTLELLKRQGAILSN